MLDFPQVDAEKCDGCGLCIDICGCHIISLVNNRATIVPKNHCTGCRQWCTLCEDICPNKAIYCTFDVVIEQKTDTR